MNFKNVALSFLAAIPLLSFAQEYPFQDPSLPAHDRAVDLMNRLTLEEKSQLMLDQSAAIPRLGIKTFHWWSEALHGVANQGNVTVFPEPIGMAASFNEDMVFNVFDATSTEARAIHNERERQGLEERRFYGLSFWTPNVNIFRDPRWGRGQETYGEDPYLTSVMGVKVIQGLQGPADAKYRKLLACAKHFAVHSGPEWARHTDNITNVEPRDLFETYLPAFQAAVQKGDVREVMCAYQRWEDEPCCGSERLLQQILREEWGFKYMVVSDCSAISDFWQTHKTSSDATHAAAVGVLAGTDVECGYNYAYKSIPEAVRLGLMKEEDVNQKVIRLLEARISLGEFDPAEMVEWKQIPMDKVAGKEHKQLSLDMARQTITLLQNKNNILPLDKKIKKIAVIGPNADIETMMWGNYNGTPTQTISFLEGVKEKVKKSAITYMQGCDYTNMKTLHSMYDECEFDGKAGMKATFWNNTNREGEPVNVIWENAPFSKTTFGNYAFAPGVNLESFSAIYETYFTPSESGKVLLDMTSCGDYELRVDGETKVKRQTWLTLNERSFIEVEKGKTYHIEILYTQVPSYNTNLKFDLGFEKEFNYDDVISKLEGIEVVLFAGGISACYEGEEMPVEVDGFKGGDRTSIEFPVIQRTLIQKLKEAGKKVILVNFSGSAMALLPETENCEAIVQAWYPGEMGGRAVADVLFGDYNPGGKLPVTFYKSNSQLPDYSDYSMKGRTYRYFDDALFPFGYGLSYTTFSVGQAEIEKKANGNVDVTVPIKNTGSRAGSEVLQIYVKALKDVNGPSKSLRAFKRVELNPDESMNVKFELEPESFSFFDEKSNTMICVDSEDVEYEIYYGTSSQEKDLKSLQIVIEGYN